MAVWPPTTKFNFLSSYMVPQSSFCLWHFQYIHANSFERSTNSNGSEGRYMRSSSSLIGCTGQASPAKMVGISTIPFHKYP